MSALRVLVVPFDAGVEGERMGAGPDALVGGGLLDRLRLRHDADGVRIAAVEAWRAELQTTFQLHHEVAQSVRAARAEGRAPVVLAGDCSMTVAVVAGLGTEQRTGVIWFDAHGDFNTPETDERGYLDGQGLSMLTGRSWRAHSRAIEGFAPVRDPHVLLVGARDLDDEERVTLNAAHIGGLNVEQCRSQPARLAALAQLVVDVDHIHIHFDADVLDPDIAPANSYASPGGLQPVDVMTLINEVSTLRPVVSATVASWDPAFDPEAKLLHALLDVIDGLAQVIRAP